jgi:hypothetical protein
MLINSDQDFITVQTREDGLFYGGCFIEEGFVDSYRVRGAQEIYGARKLKFIERMTPGDDHLQLAYTDRATNDPRYSVQEGCIYIPWKYMKSTAPYKGRGLAMKNSISELAAYGIDLLDARLPGLHDEMKRSHADPMLKRDIAERINSIKPGLYAELLSLDYIGKDFYRGLATIHEALGYAR